MQAHGIVGIILCAPFVLPLTCLPCALPFDLAFAALVGILKPLKDQHCLEGETVTLSCEVVDKNYSAKWFKNGEPITIDGKKYKDVKQVKKRMLLIHDTDMDDQCQYSCECKGETTSCMVTVEGESAS